MKKLLTAVSICSIAALGFAASSAHADVVLSSKSKTATIHFVPEENGKEYFWCQVSDPTATVIVQTADVDAQGFCPNGNGTVPGSTFNTSYFAVNGAGIDPYVTLTVTKGHFIGCPQYGQQNPPSGLNPYQPNAHFCVVGPKK